MGSSFPQLVLNCLHFSLPVARFLWVTRRRRLGISYHNAAHDAAAAILYPPAGIFLVPHDA